MNIQRFITNAFCGTEWRFRPEIFMPAVDELSPHGTSERAVCIEIHVGAVHYSAGSRGGEQRLLDGSIKLEGLQCRIKHVDSEPGLHSSLEYSPNQVLFRRWNGTLQLQYRQSVTMETETPQLACQILGSAIAIGVDR